MKLCYSLDRAKCTCPAAAHALLKDTLSMAEGILGIMLVVVDEPTDSLTTNKYGSEKSVIMNDS